MKTTNQNKNIWNSKRLNRNPEQLRDENDYLKRERSTNEKRQKENRKCISEKGTPGHGQLEKDYQKKKNMRRNMADKTRNTSPTVQRYSMTPAHRDETER